ncbi:hypothetical protein VaNZ11_015155 [Volvox africanus]|uniref:Uncharacterized protein n=1 Tax=Volvox africanus TaxID=51714 RepID=A0ABQ5SKE9_9CHLO|nr:hypothetical protein VaNZ11_015155 [Volvox africanus]
MDATPSPGRPARHGVYLTLAEHIALNRIRAIVHDCFDKVAYNSAQDLGRVLAEKQLFVTVRTSLPHGFHSLRHQYLLVQTQVGGAAIVVDLEFRDRFYYTGLPGGSYAACVAALPKLFVGTMASITAIVSVMSDALEREAYIKAHDLPPWRSRRALFANWFPERFTDDVYPPPSAALHPVLLHTCHTQPAFRQTALNTAQAGLDPAVTASPFGACPVTTPAKRVTAAAGASAAVYANTGVGVGDGAGVEADEDAGGCPNKPHGLNKRKAEGAAGMGSPVKTRGSIQSFLLPMVALHQNQDQRREQEQQSQKKEQDLERDEEQPQQTQALLTLALQRADSSAALSRGAYGVPPCVLTGFSARSSLTASITSTTVTDLSSEAPRGSCNGSSTSMSSSNGGEYDGSSGKAGAMVDAVCGYVACEGRDTDPWVTHDRHSRRRDSIGSGDSGDTACSISKRSGVTGGASADPRPATHIAHASQRPWTSGATITAAAVIPSAAASRASRARSGRGLCCRTRDGASAAEAGNTQLDEQSGYASSAASQPPSLGEAPIKILGPDQKLTLAAGLDPLPDGKSSTCMAAIRTATWRLGSPQLDEAKIGVVCGQQVTAVTNASSVAAAVVPTAETVPSTVVTTAFVDRKVLLLAARHCFTGGAVVLTTAPPASTASTAVANALLPTSFEPIRLAPSPSGRRPWLLKGADALPRIFTVRPVGTTGVAGA